MATREDIKAAKTGFGEWFPRHGVLQTQRNDLYVALHKALESNEVDRRQLISLGEKIKTALSQRPRDELRLLVERAEEIHNEQGLEAALAHLHGELEPKAAADKAATPVKARIPGAAMSQALEEARFSGKPSERLAQLEQILDRRQPKALTRGLEALLKRRQDALIRTARKSGKVERIARTILTLSEKTSVPADEVKAKLLEVLDKAHEIDEDQAPHVNEIFAKLAETGSIQNKAQLARVLKLFRNSASRLDRKIREVKGKTGATETPTVFADTLKQIEELNRARPQVIPLNFLAGVLQRRIKEYEATAGVRLEEVEELNLEPEEDGAA